MPDRRVVVSPPPQAEGHAGGCVNCRAVSTLAIVIIVVVGVFVLLFLGGVAYTVRRERRTRVVDARRIAEADHALERARAADKGWDRELIESAAQEAIAVAHPGWRYDTLELVLVDDRPGVNEDRAHLVATSAEGDLRLVLARDESGWHVESLS
jgi:cbb3-type cytochrome oxidase subunit 3